MRIAHLLIALALVGAGNVQAAGNAEAGKKAAETCMGCHAVQGYFNVYPSYKVPKLGGQQAAYIEEALKAYRSGTRQHPTMQANAANLSDQQIADIAAFFSAETQETPAANPPQKATLVELGKEKSASCAACHGADGNSAAPNFPRLAGQHASYLANSLESYKNGKRQNPVMAGMAAALSAEDIEALGAYYSVQTGLSTLAVPEKFQ